MQVLLDGAADADPFELDARLRRAFSLEQRLDARMGPLLFRVWGRWLHRALGYSTREAYARERLGMDATRARALVRLERAAMRSEPFARAYRSGGLSWVKAALLVPLVDRDPLGRFMGEWVTWAQRVTVRRLRADVDWAVTLQDVDPEAFRRTGGLPADREIGSQLPNPTSEADAPCSVTDAERPTLRAASEPCTVHMVGPPDVVRLLRAVLCTVRRRMEAVDGKLPTEGQALGVMLDYAFACWGIGDKVPSEHRVFERDGWLCRVPGCTSMENLQKHHIQFRGKAPLAVYGSGDVEIVDGDAN